MSEDLPKGITAEEAGAAFHHMGKLIREPAEDVTPPTLPEFLLARFADDKRTILGTLGADDQTTFDPDRMLAECEAKRRIVERFIGAHEQLRLGTEYGLTFRYGLAVACEELASSYADHPDYRPEWKP